MHLIHFQTKFIIFVVRKLGNTAQNNVIQILLAMFEVIYVGFFTRAYERGSE